MKFKYQLPNEWVSQVAKMDEFANGATQITVKVKGDTKIKSVLISNGLNIVAVRGYYDLPFSPDQIEDVFQTEEDKNPAERGGWEFWDRW